ncbi:MAG TPA: hypothetical protein VGK84_08915 [Candidatus Tumulicola sp.]|jgi:hypothetical protein
MTRHLQTAAAVLALTALAACASRAGVPAGPSGTAASVPAVRTNDYGNIRWNKPSVHVYKSKGASTASLTFWAKNGYILFPQSCEHGGQFVGTPGTVKGNPNRYERVQFSFVAKTGKADQCTFTAVLNNTGSPPIATLAVYLNS